MCRRRVRSPPFAQQRQQSTDAKSAHSGFCGAYVDLSGHRTLCHCTLGCPSLLLLAIFEKAAAVRGWARNQAPRQD